MAKAKWRPMDPATAFPPRTEMTSAWLEAHFGSERAPGYSPTYQSRTEECMLFKRTRSPLFVATGWAHEVIAEMPQGRAVQTGYWDHSDESVAIWPWTMAMDAALVDNCFIVDAWQPWATGVEARGETEDEDAQEAVPPLSARTVFDLRDPEHVAELERIHGDLAKWTVLPDWFRAIRQLPAPARPDWMEAA